MSVKQEPPFVHGQVPRTGVLLVNLGTPAAPTAPALRRYLAQFLSDPRVVEIPRALWLPILHGIILRVRPAKSAAKYASIWTPEGSPLRAWTEKQTTLLQGFMGELGHLVSVRHAMRYGEPSIGGQLDALKAEGATRILVVPLYPQYSGATTASVMDEVFAWGSQTRLLPELRHINRFHDDAGYIGALAATVQAHWAGRLLAERLGLSADQYLVTFQSRFGKAKWLEPYTEPTLVKLAKAGTRKVDVICPGFVGDCIETLEEIAMEAKQAFLGHGGEAFEYIPCLNGDLGWIKALSALVERHLQGWPTRAEQQASAQVLGEQAQRAKALGCPH